MKSLFLSLPPIFQELLKFGLGFYLLTAAIGTFCNWSSPYRWQVVYTLLVFLVIVLILELLGALAVRFVWRRRQEK